MMGAWRTSSLWANIYREKGNKAKREREREVVDRFLKAGRSPRVPKLIIT